MAALELDFRWVTSGSNPYELVKVFRSSEMFPHGRAGEVSVNYEGWQGSPENWETLLDSQEERVSVTFNVYEHISMEDDRVNVLVVPQVSFFTLCMSELKRFPFSLFTSSSSLGDDWDELSPSYYPPSFADRHVPHGWACAFKGAGHNRLVSRRWLEYGPWRLIRDEESDLSFIQFHDLEADPETALEQAKPGHERMGISLSGGFISKTWLKPTRLPERGFYRGERKVVEYVITGRELEDQAYYEATQSRYHADQAFNEEVEVENIAFVFMDEDNARKHLHELWLRELECWAIIDGEKVRLDDTYQPPPPQKPQWVLDVEAREAAQG